MCRCDRIRQKDNAITRGGLPNYGLDWEKSAEAIVGEGATDLQYQQQGMTAAYERTVLAELPDKRSRH